MSALALGGPTALSIAAAGLSAVAAIIVLGLFVGERRARTREHKSSSVARLRRPHPRRGLRWLIVIVGAAAVGLLLQAALSQDSRPEPFAGGARMIAGYGPSDRPTSRCVTSRHCDGSKDVTFNSYTNNPMANDERPFLAVKDASSDPTSAVVETLDVRSTTRELILRVFIDNNAVSADALDTRLHVALPKGPVYATNPTAYLRASNAKPGMIWDTVTLRSKRPMSLSYVRNSSWVDRRTPSSNDRPASDRLPDGITDPKGISLGAWKAGLRHAGWVTFRVRVTLLSEPVRDPRATRGFDGRVVYARASTRGRAREPVRDGFAGDRFRCRRTSCLGPPFAELNAFENHPLLGDEADFVRAATGDGYGDEGHDTYRTVALVEPGDQIKVRIALDNGGDPGSLGAPPRGELVARDVRIRVLMPVAESRNLRIVAFINSSTTRPQEIIDTLPVRSTQAIRLRIRPDTARLTTAHDRRPPSAKLFATSRSLSAREGWGISVDDIAPSFSQVAYVEFEVSVTDR